MDAGKVGLDVIGGREALVLRDQLHWAIGAQCAEAGMHFRDEPARKGARRRVAGPHPGIRVTFGQGFGDGKRFANDGAFGGAQDRNQARRGERGQIICHRAGIKPDEVALIGQIEFFEHEPAAQGPA